MKHLGENYIGEKWNSSVYLLPNGNEWIIRHQYVGWVGGDQIAVEDFTAPIPTFTRKEAERIAYLYCGISPPAPPKSILEQALEVAEGW